MTVPAFIFTDLVGFTSFTEANGDEAAADLAEHFCARVREINEGHNAEDVKTLGDGCMIHVPNAGCAAELGLEIVEALGPAHGLPDVRVGIDAGPALERGGDWFGMTVNRAARLVELAGVGSVVATDHVERIKSGHTRVRFLPKGTRRLRGISKPAAIFEVVRPAPRL